MNSYMKYLKFVFILIFVFIVSCDFSTLVCDVGNSIKSDVCSGADFEIKTNPTSTSDGRLIDPNGDQWGIDYIRFYQYSNSNIPESYFVSTDDSSKYLGAYLFSKNTKLIDGEGVEKIYDELWYVDFKNVDFLVNGSVVINLVPDIKLRGDSNLVLSPDIMEVIKKDKVDYMLINDKYTKLIRFQINWKF